MPAEFKETLLNNCKRIIPLIVYTDNTFGFDGVNRIFREKFQNLLSEIDTQNIINVLDVTFVNLSFFEMFDNYIKNGVLSLSEIISKYIEYTRMAGTESTPFEVFAAAYKQQFIKQDLGLPFIYLEVCANVNIDLANY